MKTLLSLLITVSFSIPSIAVDSCCFGLAPARVVTTAVQEPVCVDGQCYGLVQDGPIRSTAKKMKKAFQPTFTTRQVVVQEPVTVQVAQVCTPTQVVATRSVTRVRTVVRRVANLRIFRWLRPKTRIVCF